MEYKIIEDKWQKYWAADASLWRAKNFSDKPKKYVLVEFPYPSGSGLHVGHAFSFTGGDVYARFKRMQGYNVLFPMGWDAFGLPTENYAIKTKQKPQKVTKDNTDMFRSQMKRLAFSFDWEREVNTTDPSYYKWTQWIFIKLFEKGLAYKQEMPINWCPSCKIGLANEEVVNGHCERCGTEVSRRNISQWVVKITEYADRLIEGLKDTAFIDKVKMAQINWIGKSEGARVKFKVNGLDRDLEVFTTRPDTLHGVTFMVVAPEHELVSKILSGEIKIWTQSVEPIQEYVKQARSKSDLERTELTKDKTGVPSGLYAINPVNGEEIPIWISDFVLSSYGTGAIMAVPAHDERDHAFAKKFDLPIIKVIDFKDELHVIVKKEFVGEEFEKEIKKTGAYIESNNDEWWLVANQEKAEGVKKIIEEGISEAGWADVDGVYRGRITKHGLVEGWSFEEDHYGFCYSNANGVAVNSGEWNGKTTKEAISEAIKFIKQKGIGEGANSYHLRDWIFSRQHYWGEPIPMVNCPKCGWVPEKEENLPIVLPEVEAYEPTDDGQSPLSKIESFVKCTCPRCGEEAKRETDTMPNWAGSDWYFLRYMDPDNESKLVDFDLLKYWGPVDVYIGGDEHNTLHLLYSRFIYQFLYDLGIFPEGLPEPYYKRTSHGVILGPDNQRMSKSRGNVIVPETVADKYGVDVIRMYLMFMGPFDGTMAWNENTLMGVKRFLERFQKAMKNLSAGKSNNDLLINKTIDGVTRDIEVFGYNTAIAKLMEALNKLTIRNEELGIEDKKTMIKLIAPFAPYTAEELWSQFNEGSVHAQSWPVADKKYLVEEEVTVMVAVNGKVRDQIKVQSTKSKDQKEIIEMAKSLEKIKPWLEGKEIVKEIYVPGKMVNIVVK